MPQDILLIVFCIPFKIFNYPLSNVWRAFGKFLRKNIWVFNFWDHEVWEERVSPTYPCIWWLAKRTRKTQRLFLPRASVYYSKRTHWRKGNKRHQANIGGVQELASKCLLHPVAGEETEYFFLQQWNAAVHVECCCCRKPAWTSESRDFYWGLYV